MQSHIVDQKLSTLFDRYKDRDFVVQAQKEVEDIRRKAIYTGATITGSAFFLNEIVRLTKRSRTKCQYLFILYSSVQIKDSEPCSLGDCTHCWCQILL